MKTQHTLRLLPILMLFLLSSHAKAQAPQALTVQYEFAVVQINPWQRKLHISINGETHEEMKLDKDEVKSIEDVTAALKEIRKMNKEGWEVYQASQSIVSGAGAVPSYVFFLRRKTE